MADYRENLNINEFRCSLLVSKHPLTKFSIHLRNQYFQILDLYVGESNPSEFVTHRLQNYRDIVCRGKKTCGGYLGLQCTKLYLYVRKLLFSMFTKKGHSGDSDIEEIIKAWGTLFWNNKYLLFLVCDYALIVLDEKRVADFIQKLKQYIPANKLHKFDDVFNALEYGNFSDKISDDLLGLITVYRKNIEWQHKNIKKVVVVANMSAGKSTLINALIGKKILKSSQAMCTGNVTYVYSKPFEDGKITLINDKLCCEATEKDLQSISWEHRPILATYFRLSADYDNPVCVIDTPGVNSIFNQKHKDITQKFLLNEEYDKVVCVLDGCQMGTNDERDLIVWLSQNVKHDKLIFVVNKLDTYNSKEDDIEHTLNEVRNDIQNYGLADVKILLLSSYLALLSKQVNEGDLLDEDETEDYQCLKKRFSKAKFDLLSYTSYNCNDVYEGGDIEKSTLLQKTGFALLEKIILGGKK